MEQKGVEGGLLIVFIKAFTTKFPFFWNNIFFFFCKVFVSLGLRNQPKPNPKESSWAWVRLKLDLRLIDQIDISTTIHFPPIR